MTKNTLTRSPANYNSDVAFELERQKTLEAACRLRFPQYDACDFYINNDDVSLQKNGFDCGFFDGDEIHVIIDVKERRTNCTKYWGKDHNGNLIPEIWIDLLSNPNSGDPGWMFGSKKITNIVLTRWSDDPKDSHVADYQILRFGLHFCADLIKPLTRPHDDNTKIGKLAAALPITVYNQIVRRHATSTITNPAVLSTIPDWLDGIGPDVEWKYD